MKGCEGLWMMRAGDGRTGAHQTPPTGLQADPPFLTLCPEPPPPHSPPPPACANYTQARQYPPLTNAWVGFGDCQQSVQL